MIVATLDTNVIAAGIAGYRKAESTPGAILRAFIAEAFDLILSRHILDELERTMMTPYFRRIPIPDQYDEILDYFDDQASYVSVTITVQGIATHAEDDLVLATAVSGNADYLVTGDKGLLSVGSTEASRS